MKNLQVLVTFGYVLTTFCNCCKIYAHFNFGLGLPAVADALSVAVAAFFFLLLLVVRLTKMQT